MKYCLLALILLVSCGKTTGTVSPQPNIRSEELRGKYKEAIEVAKKGWDQETGWPSKEDCDGTLWAGLARAAGIESVRLELARHADGKIHRRPYEPCYKDGVDLGAKSTISKDMLLGYVYGMFRFGNVEELEYLFDYGKANSWIMGDPSSELGRVLLTPNGIATLCNAIKNLGGKSSIECSLPVSFQSGDADFEKHLAVLGILLWSETHKNEIPQDALKTLKDLAYNNTQDALFNAAYTQYSSGDYSFAIDLLLDPNYQYPSYVRGSKNYELVHWLFAAKLILKHFGG